MGITIECAQCHDHKYDPFSQKDYYSLLAFSTNTKEVGYEGDVSISKPAKTRYCISTTVISKRPLIIFQKGHRLPHGFCYG